MNSMVWRKVVAFTVVMLPIVLMQSCLISGDQAGCWHASGSPSPRHLASKVHLLEASETSYIIRWNHTKALCFIAYGASITSMAAVFVYKMLLPTRVLLPHYCSRCGNSMACGGRPFQKGPCGPAFQCHNCDQGGWVTPSDPSSSWPKCPPWGIKGVNP